MVRDYWPTNKKRYILALIITQIILAEITMLTLMISGALTELLPVLIVGCVSLIIGLTFNIILFSFLSSPLRDILNALTHVSSEPNVVKPPNLNAKRYELEGMKPVLQLIYNLAAERASKCEEADEGSITKVHKNTLTTALDQSSASVIIMTSDGEITYASKNAPLMTDKDDIQQLQLIFEDEVNFSLWLKDCNDRLVHDEKQWLRVPDKIIGDEDRRIFDITASYEKGSASEVVLLLFDRTLTYRPEDEQLDFVSFAAHELRGPITVIRGYLDVLSDELDEVLTPDQRTLISRLVVSSNRLSSYINNILNASRYDRRHMSVYLAEHTVREAYDVIGEDMEMRASAQNRLIHADISQDLPTIAADLTSLSEVFSNLIDNGIKYSNEGGAIEVTAHEIDGYVQIDVTDHGIGMPANVMSNLFHKFFRSHRSRETVAGTGIGLYICKAIVESHGGIIEVKSTEGRGSTFSFTVPIYSTVADKIRNADGTNKGIIRLGNDGWIKNHSKYRG